jgi:O-antigen/teichoic acid export membrane protein
VTSATRGGALIAAASLAGIVLTYVFLLASGRLLGAEDYGALAAVLGLLTVVLLPAGALQFAVSREVSRRAAMADGGDSTGFVRAVMRLSAVATVPLVLLTLALSVPLARLLGIPTSAVVLTAVGLAAAFVGPVAVGTIQGYQRFGALAAMYVLPLALRLAILGVVAGAGFLLGGAVFATVAAGLGATAIALVLIRDPLRRGAAAARPELRPFLRYLVPVVVGLIGIALLTNIDILVVKARFSGSETGQYAAAAAFAKVAFFLPATVLAVLFPRTAARQARGEETTDILGRSLLVVGGFCAALALFYAAAGRGLLVLTYGPDFAEGGKLTASFAVAMGLYSLANVLVGYHLSRDETRYAWIVVAAAPIQVVALAVAPLDLQDVVWANLAVATGLLAAHEVFVESSVPALGEGIRWVRRAIDERVLGIAREGAVVLLGATAFVALLFWPVVVHLNSTVVGRGSDASAAIWTFWAMQHESGFHVFGITHHTLTGAPFGWDDGNGLNLQAVLAYYPAYLLTKVVGEVAAYNLVLLSGYVLSGAAMYLLVRYLGCTRLVSAWAGMVFVVFPWHLVRTPHASLVHVELLPILLLTLIAAARSPTLVRCGLVGIVTLGCWLTAGYIGALAFVGAVAFAVAGAFTLPRSQALRYAAGSIGAALAASLFVAFLSVVSGVGRGVGLHRVAGDLHSYGLRPLELVVPSAQNLVLGHWLGSFWSGRQHGSNPTETNNYLGLLTIALCVLWVVVASGRWVKIGTGLRTATVGSLAVVVLGLVLAAPSPVVVFGHAFTAPSRLVWDVVPAIRVPARWVVLAMTALIPLAALGLQWMSGWFGRRSRWRGAAIGVVVAALVVSFLELAVNPARPRFRTTVPVEYTALRTTPPGIVAEYPLGQDPDQLFWQRTYGRPFLGGVPAGTPSQADDARRVLVDPAVPGTAEQLALLGVTAIVTHPDALTFAQPAPLVRAPNWGPGYSLVARAPDDTSVWRVVAAPAPALVTLTGGFSGPTGPTHGVVGYPFVSPSGVGTIELTAQRAAVVRLSFLATPPGREQTLRLADETNELSFPLDGRTPVSALVQIPRGRSFVLVKTDPAATSEEDAIVLSAARATRATGSAQLQAETISADPGF